MRLLKSMKHMKRQQTILRRSVALMFALSLVGTGAAQAQIATGAGVEVEKGSVTAGRHAGLIENVPGLASAISSAELDTQAIADITALTDMLPNSALKTPRIPSTTVPAFIRGIGQRVPVAGDEQGIGIDLDNIYLARPQGRLSDMYDLERIDVLRGPQNTLYGRNTIGGALRYVARTLPPNTAFGLTAALGSDGERDLVLSASTPLSDMLRIGVTAATFHRNGFAHNVINGKDNNNDKQRVAAGRISVELTPSSDLSIRFSLDRTVDDSVTRCSGMTGRSPPRAPRC